MRAHRLCLQIGSRALRSFEILGLHFGSLFGTSTYIMLSIYAGDNGNCGRDQVAGTLGRS